MGLRWRPARFQPFLRTAKTLEEKLTALDALFEQMMAELDANDLSEKSQKTLDGEGDSATQLPKPLAELNQRRQRVREALTQAQAADESRRKLGKNPEKNPVSKKANQHHEDQ